MTHYADTAEIAAYAAKTAAALPAFIVTPNGYGVRLECRACHASSRTPGWAYGHEC